MKSTPLTSVYILYVQHIPTAEVIVTKNIVIYVIFLGLMKAICQLDVKNVRGCYGCRASLVHPCRNPVYKAIDFLFYSSKLQIPLNSTQLYWRSPPTGKLLQHKENIQPFIQKSRMSKFKTGHNGGFVTAFRLC